MKINLSPSRRDDALTVEKTGDRLRINGELFNFNPVPEGATIKLGDIPCEWICSDVTRINGDIELTIILPHGADPAEYVAFPEPIENPPDGVLDLPFSPYVERSEETVEGGHNDIRTTYHWRHEPVVTVEFIPDPPPVEEEQENANVDA